MSVIKDEHSLRVFEKSVQKIFESRRDEVTEVWIRLHNEELHNLHSSSRIIRMMKLRKMRGAKQNNAYRILVRRLKGNRPVGKP
jgi:hypothetical protein